MTTLVWILGALCIVSGLTAIGLGLSLTTEQWRKAKRVHRIQSTALLSMPEGWGPWFAQGFFDMTVATRFTTTAALFVCWMILGIWIASIGLRLAW